MVITVLSLRLPFLSVVFEYIEQIKLLVVEYCRAANGFYICILTFYMVNSRNNLIKHTFTHIDVHAYTLTQL